LEQHSGSPRIFYGWYVVAASFVIALYVGGAVFYGFTAIFKPVVDEFGWSYAQVSLAASLRGVEMGLFAPLFGALVDRWGPRRLVAAAAVITATGLFMLSQCHSLAMFYGAFIVIALGMSGSTTTVLMTAVGNWFRRRVGLATGIAVSGFGFGGLMVSLINRLIEVYDWRTAVTVLAAGALLIVLPLSLFLRHRPEQYGYLPDGEVKSPESVELSPQTSAEVSIGVKQALGSRTFWHLTVAFTSQVLIVTALITHVMPYLISLNMLQATAALVATAVPLVSIGGRLGLGWFGDRVDRRHVAAGAFALMGLGLVCFGIAADTGWLVPFLVLFGVGYGGGMSLRPSLIREYFGWANFGTVFGVLMGISLVGSIGGPLLLGWVYDTQGSYQNIWFVFAGLAALGLVAVLTTPAVSKRD
jgi:MFS family permease